MQQGASPAPPAAIPSSQNTTTRLSTMPIPRTSHCCSPWKPNSCPSSGQPQGPCGASPHPVLRVPLLLLLLHLRCAPTAPLCANHSARGRPTWLRCAVLSSSNLMAATVRVSITSVQASSAGHEGGVRHRSLQPRQETSGGLCTAGRGAGNHGASPAPTPQALTVRKLPVLHHGGVVHLALSEPGGNTDTQSHCLRPARTDSLPPASLSPAATAARRTRPQQARGSSTAASSGEKASAPGPGSAFWLKKGCAMPGLSANTGRQRLSTGDAEPGEGKTVLLLSHPASPGL